MLSGVAARERPCNEKIDQVAGKRDSLLEEYHLYKMERKEFEKEQMEKEVVMEAKTMSSVDLEAL